MDTLDHATESRYLSAVLRTHHVSLEEDKLHAYRAERERIKVSLQQQYGDTLYNPINSGSYAKHTAINTRFDMDIALPFRRSRFGTIGAMYEDVHEFLRHLQMSRAHPIQSIRCKRRCIHILLEVNGELLDMDIVPGRELEEGRYPSDGNLFLYDRALDSRVQTNVRLHNTMMEGCPDARELVRLLKVWRQQVGIRFKSFLIELLVLRALDEYPEWEALPLYERMLRCAAFIADSLEEIRLLDPANSNNIVSDCLSPEEKQGIARALREMRRSVERRRACLLFYFPINSAHGSLGKEEVNGIWVDEGAY